MKQGGIYTLSLTERLDTNQYDCELTFDNKEEHDEIAWMYYMPIWAAVLVIITLYALYAIYECIVARTNKSVVENETFELDDKLASTPPPPTKKRLVSLDTFRGISLALMIFVNFGGGDYWFFEHAPWDGLTMADLMMPWFLFMAGVSIRFGIKSRLKRAKSKWHIVWEILVRTAKLSFLGLCVVGGSSNWDKIRLPGVLQRIAIGYCVVSLMHLVSPHVDKCSTTIKEELKFYWPEHVIAHLMLTTFCIITYTLPIDGDCPAGYTGPGGISESGKYKGCIGGAARYIDELIFGNKHMYCHPTAEEMYETETGGRKTCFDPEGLLGNLTSIYLTYLGLQAGKVFSTYPNFKDKKHMIGIVGHLAVGILFYGILGCLLATIGSEYENGELISRPIVPINKNLWSVSFVFVCGSLGYLMLLMLFFLCDYFEVWNGKPFYFMGRNSILIYLLHSICDGIPWEWNSQVDSHSEEMLMCCTNVMLWATYAWWCFDRDFFVTV